MDLGTFFRNRVFPLVAFKRTARTEPRYSRERIILTGGSAFVELIGNALTKSTEVRSVIANQEKNCGAEGLLKAIRH